MENEIKKWSKEQEGIKAIRRNLVFQLQREYNLDEKQIRVVLNMTDSVIRGIIDNLETERLMEANE